MAPYFFKDALLHKKEEVFLLNFLQGLDAVFSGFFISNEIPYERRWIKTTANFLILQTHSTKSFLNRIKPKPLYQLWCPYKCMCNAEAQRCFTG